MKLRKLFKRLILLFGKSRLNLSINVGDKKKLRRLFERYLSKNKINMDHVKQILENQEKYLKAHPELKNLSAKELKERLYKFIVDGLPKPIEFKEMEIIRLNEHTFTVKK